jgi:hypothetical protein
LNQIARITRVIESQAIWLELLPRREINNRRGPCCSLPEPAV